MYEKPISMKFVLGVMFGIGAGFGLATALYYDVRNDIPLTNKVQQGYVVPSKLEVELHDTDLDGEDEVFLKYDNTMYRFRVGEDNVPKLVEFEK